MDNPFFVQSTDIANDFLQSIVFIDDRAYVTSGNSDSVAVKQHDFDALKVTRAFAKSKKVCAVYKPETMADIDNLIHLVKKADITVIDWQIRISEESAESNSEEDAENDDPRGPHTLRIIREILSDPLTGAGSLKLIIVYTGEIRLHDITDAIFEDLQKQNIQGLKKEICKVYTENVKILVLAKPSTDNEEGGESKFKHNPELNDKVVDYENLPDVILKEFTLMTSSLLSNFVLKSLTILRKNTFRLVKLYNKELDPSFIVHRLLLPDQESSKEQMVEVFADSVHALLNYNNAGDSLSISDIELWLNLQVIKREVEILKRKIIVDNKLISQLLKDGLKLSLERYWEEHKFGDFPKNAVDNLEKKIFAFGAAFIAEGIDSDKIDCEFSILTHHKSNLKQPSSNPKMSLGTIVRDVNTGRYYLCIQAKCDSVRLNEERRFLFVPLIVIDSTGLRFQIVVGEANYTKLQIKKDAFELRTIKFRPRGNGESVSAEFNDPKFVFQSIYNEQFEWICDLKDLHAQRAATNYAYQLSRVGLDEAEWLRRSSLR